MNPANGSKNPLVDAWRERRLIVRMVKREVIGRYRGSMLGLLWSFFHPLVMLGIYSFVFGFVFRARWGMETPHNFALILFTGLVFHALLAECLSRAPTLIISNVNYVKKVVFPLHSLGWVAVGSSAFHFAVSLLILFIGQLFLSHTVPWTWLLLPVVAAPFLLLCLGVVWLFSSLGVYLRDVAHVTGIATTLLLFLAPILYPITLIPEQYRIYLYLNPLTYLVEQARAILVWGELPDFLGLGLYALGAAVFAQVAYLFFQKTKKGFADVV